MENNQPNVAPIYMDNNNNSKTKAFAITAMACGISGAIFALIMFITTLPIALFVIGVAASIVAIVFGILVLKNKSPKAKNVKGMSIAGLATGAAAVVVDVIMLIISLTAINAAKTMVNDIFDNFKNGGTQEIVNDAKDIMKDAMNKIEDSMNSNDEDDNENEDENENDDNKTDTTQKVEDIKKQVEETQKDITEQMKKMMENM